MGPPKVRQCVHLHSLKGKCKRTRVQRGVLHPGVRRICKGARVRFPEQGLAKLRELCCSCLCRVKMFPGGPGQVPCTIHSSVQELRGQVDRVRFLRGRRVAAERRLTTCQGPLRRRMLSLVGRHERLCQGRPNNVHVRRVGKRLGRLHGGVHLDRRVRGRSLRVRRQLERTGRRRRMRRVSKGRQERTR